jgi:uncharacterized protein (DUF111 family)
MTPPAGYETDRVVRLEVNLDDLSPEVTGATMEALFAAGALDVWLTPIQMKKNRPGTMLSVLCEEAAVEALAEIIFRETTTFGVRIEQVLRLKLERRFEQVATEFGEVTVKVGLRNGEVIQRAPEFESCKAVAQASGQPLRAVYEAAVRARR